MGGESGHRGTSGGRGGTITARREPLSGRAIAPISPLRHVAAQSPFPNRRECLPSGFRRCIILPTAEICRWWCYREQRLPRVASADEIGPLLQLRTASGGKRTDAGAVSRQ